MSTDTRGGSLYEQIEVAGDQLVDEIKNLVHEGNVRDTPQGINPCGFLDYA